MRRAVAGTSLLLALTACSTTSSSDSAHPTRPSSPPSSATATTTRPAPSSDAPDTPTSAPTSTTSSPPTTPTTGASDSAGVEPGRDLLAWSEVPGPTGVTTTVGTHWTLRLPQGGQVAKLTGPKHLTIAAGSGHRISKAVMNDHHALVVSQSDNAQSPDVATVVDLDHGTSYRLDGASHPATSIGGTWALGTDSLVHATYGSRHRYCLASVDLAGRQGQIDLCVPPHHGLSRAALSDAGETLMTFDDQQPSCRTLVSIIQLQPTPLPGVTRCIGWDSLATPDGAVWSVVSNQSRIEAAHFYARAGATSYDLGPGTSGTLVQCGDAAYFVRDPHGSGDHADLLRWRGGHLDVVFESKGTGKAFLSAPRCAGSHLTINAYSAAGDQQVTATVG